MTRKNAGKVAARARQRAHGGSYQEQWRSVGGALPGEAERWARDLVQLWRVAWHEASAEVRESVGKFFLSCEPPTRAIVRLRVGDDSPVAAFGVELQTAPDGRDLDVEVIVHRDSTADQHGVRATLDYYWRNSRANWFPGRPAVNPLNPWAASMGRLSENGGAYVVIPGAPRDLPVESLVRHYFRNEAAPPVAARHATPTPKHLYNLGQDREDTAIERWMYGHCAEVLSALGLPSGWWCGLWLQRDDIYGNGANGDIDLLAGPLELDFDETELAARVRAEASSRPLATDPGFIRNVAIMQAAQDGHVVWPPSVETVVACEVKASRFDGSAWRTTHLGEHARVKGQLDGHLDQGVDRVALLHLCATKPRDASSGNPHPWTAKF